MTPGSPREPRAAPSPGGGPLEPGEPAPPPGEPAPPPGEPRARGRPSWAEVSAAGSDGPARRPAERPGPPPRRREGGREAPQPAPGSPNPEAPDAPPPGALVVDTSYVIFARYYSALSWYRGSFEAAPDIQRIMSSPVFRNKYATGFTAGIARVCMAYGIPLDRVIFAKDCSKGMVWRRSVMPSYKGSRTQNRSFNRDVFQYTYARVIPEWIEGHGGLVIGADGAEADDVIGVAHRLLSSLPRECGRVVILTNDNDCIQLAGPNTSVVNIVMSDVAKRRGPLTPEQYLQCRVVAGDRSDNIPGVLPRCGLRSAAKLIACRNPAGIAETPEQRQALERNTTLMDLRNTPGGIQSYVADTIRASFLRCNRDPPA